jgi:hypothetical protein
VNEEDPERDRGGGVVMQTYCSEKEKEEERDA